jgi:predicted transcriptional regulator
MEEYDSIPIWDLVDYDSDLNVILSKAGRDYIRKEILKRYGLLKNAFKEIGMSYWRLIENLKGRTSIDFFKLLQLVKKLDLNKHVIEKEVEGLVIRSIKIKNVHFPLRCDPVFASLFMNLLGDGGLHKRNNTGCFHYGEPESYQLIQEKLSYVLGSTPYQEGEYIPKVLVFLMMKYFRVNNISTKQSVFPNKLLKADKFTKLASLIAFINDEGTPTTSFIQIYSSNYKLLSGVRNLAQSLGYRVSKISRSKAKKTYLFRINSVREFYEDYKELIKKYPQTRLIGRKERILRILDLTLTRPKRDRSETLNLIINTLKSGDKNIYDLCEITQMTQNGVRKYLKELINSNLIERKYSDSKTRYIYSFLK